MSMTSETAGGDIVFSPGVTGALQDGVLVVVIDHPPVNAISADVRNGLVQALDHAAGSSDVNGIIVTGAGKTFIGGADIREFGKPPSEPTLPQVVERLEACGKPVVAAINGAALGGGLEIALACHHRIASPAAKLGLPEVKLGIVPGAGGTQRLPRLTGAQAAMELIATGKTVQGAKAVELGIIDAVTDINLIGEAIHTVHTIKDRPLRRTSMLEIPSTDLPALDGAEAKILARARGQTAPAEAVRLVRLATRVPYAEGVKQERETFLRLRDSAEAASLRHVFFAERAAAKVEGLEDVAPRPVKTIGIAGLGLMGSGIAVSALAAGYRVVGFEQTTQAAANGRERIATLLEKSVKSGRLSATVRDEQMQWLTVATQDSALADCDLVIEAVFDDLAVKTELFKRLDKVVRPDAVLATNTSYLDPDEIAAATDRPGRVLGMHFFSPANIMRLAEVVRCARTAPDVLATGVTVAKRFGKLPIVTGVCEGFIGNSIFSAYRREAEYLLEDGALPHEIDAALEDYGFPMGLFAVYDLAGLEIAWARRKRQAADRGPQQRYVEIADRLCEAGRFGQKSGRGWYAYPEGKRTVDPEVIALIEAARTAKGIAPRRFTKDEILARLLDAMAAEGQKLLEKGIAARTSDIDLVMINGYGFPAHKGGPMYAAERMSETAP